MFSIDGLVSGLDTSSIIEGLLSIQQSQIDRLELQKQDVVVRQTAFQGIEANIVALQGAARQLNSFTNDVFSVFSASSSDDTVLQAAAGGDAVSGSFQLKITQLAKAAQIASQAFDSQESVLTTGELSIQVGNRTATTVELDSNNNTLQGLADSINASTDDVAATLINDGSGFRLLLTSQHTGADNSISITNNTGASTASETMLDLSGPAVQTATDAVVELGSGTGAISISRSTNTVDDVIQGLTLNLLQADASKEITVSVARDTEPARQAIEGFVTAFNNAMSYIDEQTAYNVDTEQAGLLLGDSSTNSIRNQVRNALARTIANVESDANRLSTIGITFNDTGRLQINSATLDSALSGTLEGIDVADVKRMFALDGVSSSTGITFVSGSIDTATSGDPWEVAITQVAERASIASTSTVASSLDVDGSNDSFEIEVDGVSSGTLTLEHGTYTQEELALHLQSVINQSSALGAREVSVSVAGDLFAIESATYGTRSEVGSLTGTAASLLGFSGTEYDRGKDVAGYFVVDGETETATGNGRVLTGDSGNSNTADLQLRVALNASQISGVHQSELTITRGFAATMEQIIDNLLDPDTGRFRNAIESYEDQIESLDASVERFNAIFDAKQKQLIAQFVAIESSINSLQTTSSFLASQLGTVSQLATP